MNLSSTIENKNDRARANETFKDANRMSMKGSVETRIFSKQGKDNFDGIMKECGHKLGIRCDCKKEEKGADKSSQRTI